jgi:hypothetical protein
MEIDYGGDFLDKVVTEPPQKRGVRLLGSDRVILDEARMQQTHIRSIQNQYFIENLVIML